MRNELIKFKEDKDFIWIKGTRIRTNQINCFKPISYEEPDFDAPAPPEVEVGQQPEEPPMVVRYGVDVMINTSGTFIPTDSFQEAEDLCESLDILLDNTMEVE